MKSHCFPVIYLMAEPCLSIHNNTIRFVLKFCTAVSVLISRVQSQYTYELSLEIREIVNNCSTHSLDIITRMTEWAPAGLHESTCYLGATLFK